MFDYFQYLLKIKILNPIKGKENKIIIQNEENYLLTNYENGWLKTDTKSFGVFNYLYDTVAPIITLSNLIKKKEIQKEE